MTLAKVQNHSSKLLPCLFVKMIISRFDIQSYFKCIAEEISVQVTAMQHKNTIYSAKEKFISDGKKMADTIIP